jgi:hypothetical protein
LDATKLKIEETTMNSKTVAMGLASAMALSVVSPSFAAPVMSSTTTVKDSAPAQTSEIRWRGRGYGGAAAAGALGGLVAGAAIGSALAAPSYGYGAYYNGGYAYAPSPGYYGNAYAYDPDPATTGSYSAWAYPGTYGNALGCRAGNTGAPGQLDVSTC